MGVALGEEGGRKEKEKERGKAEEAGVNHSDATVTEGGASEDKMAPAAPPPDGPAPSAPPATPPTPVSPAPAPAELGSAPAGSAPDVATPSAWEKSRTPDEGRRVKVARRSLREGKSQSLILLTGLEDPASPHGRVRHTHTHTLRLTHTHRITHTHTLTHTHTPCWWLPENIEIGRASCRERVSSPV